MLCFEDSPHSLNFLAMQKKQYDHSKRRYPFSHRHGRTSHDDSVISNVAVRNSDLLMFQYCNKSCKYIRRLLHIYWPKEGNKSRHRNLVFSSEYETMDRLWTASNPQI